MIILQYHPRELLKLKATVFSYPKALILILKKMALICRLILMFGSNGKQLFC